MEDTLNHDFEQDPNATMDVHASQALLDRLDAAVAALEAAAQKHTSIAAGADDQAIGKIVATAVSPREQELEAQLAAAEQTIASLRAGASGRKTAISATATRSGAAHRDEALDARSIDTALTSLSIEQRIAVKAEMLRNGLLR